MPVHRKSPSFRLREDLIHVDKNLKEGAEKMGPGSSHWCRVREQELMGTNGNTGRSL